jgi:hypothetical protein
VTALSAPRAGPLSRISVTAKAALVAALGVLLTAAAEAYATISTVERAMQQELEDQLGVNLRVLKARLDAAAGETSAWAEGVQRAEAGIDEQSRRLAIQVDTFVVAIRSL